MSKVVFATLFAVVLSGPLNDPSKCTVTGGVRLAHRRKNNNETVLDKRASPKVWVPAINSGYMKLGCFLNSNSPIDDDYDNLSNITPSSCASHCWNTYGERLSTVNLNGDDSSLCSCGIGFWDLADNLEQVYNTANCNYNPCNGDSGTYCAGGNYILIYYYTGLSSYGTNSAITFQPTLYSTSSQARPSSLLGCFVKSGSHDALTCKGDSDQCGSSSRSNGQDYYTSTNYQTSGCSMSLDEQCSNFCCHNGYAVSALFKGTCACSNDYLDVDDNSISSLANCAYNGNTVGGVNYRLVYYKQNCGTWSSGNSCAI